MRPGIRAFDVGCLVPWRLRFFRRQNSAWKCPIRARLRVAEIGVSGSAPAAGSGSFRNQDLDRIFAMSSRRLCVDASVRVRVSRAGFYHLWKFTLIVFISMPISLRFSDSAVVDSGTALVKR